MKIEDGRIEVSLKLEEKECINNALEELKSVYLKMNALRLKISARKEREAIVSNQIDMIKLDTTYNVNTAKDPETQKPLYSNQEQRSSAVSRSLATNKTYKDLHTELNNLARDRELAFITFEHEKDKSKYLTLSIQSGIGIILDGDSGDE